MISDDALYRLAIFLGSLAMLLIVLYHFLEINAKEDGTETKTPGAKSGAEKGAGEKGGKIGGEKVAGEKAAGVGGARVGR
jgi:oligosaccharyl transferase complex subunit OST4